MLVEKLMQKNGDPSRRGLGRAADRLEWNRMFAAICCVPDSRQLTKSGYAGEAAARGWTKILGRDDTTVTLSQDEMGKKGAHIEHDEGLSGNRSGICGAV